MRRRIVNAFAAARTRIRNCFEHFGVRILLPHVPRTQLTFSDPLLASYWTQYERIFQQARSRAVQLNEPRDGTHGKLEALRRGVSLVQVQLYWCVVGLLA